MWYIIIYIIFFIAQLFYGSWHIIGPLTPRHIMTIIMFLVCLKEHAFKRDKFMPFFYIFVFLFVILGISGGYVSETISKFIAYYFVAIVAYFATLLFVEKYDGSHYLILALLALGILNSFVTIGNMFMMSWAQQLTELLHISSRDVLLYATERGNADSMDGFAVPGLLGGVANGYFMAYLSILALYAKDKQIHVYNIVLFVLFLIALFFIQERAAFVAGVVLSMYALFRILTIKNVSNTSAKRIVLFILVTVCLICIIPYAYQYMMNGSSRYASLGFDYLDGRSSLNNKSITFLLRNPLGGFYDFYQQYRAYPHNLFFNALIYGGMMGGACLLILLWKQISLVFSTVTKRITQLNYELFIFSLMFAAYNICSLTHNQSVVTGDPTFWVLWALCLTSWKKIHSR